ncbi:hypothetical protein [Morganella morganii]|uniref:hypothetical protein n=1 Tax=Morganella morganii TaxID=582 RepID=UPI001C491A5D|nr:hypothetical protein [Morganella morganii]QXO64406.1 hypothetical protein JC825_13560 [Morganella morganii]
MATITVIPKKDNAKNRRLAKQMAFWDRKREEYAAKPKSRSVEDIFDSIIKPECHFETLAQVVIEMKKLPEAPRKQLRMNRKPIMPNGGITARA